MVLSFEILNYGTFCCMGSKVWGGGSDNVGFLRRIKQLVSHLYFYVRVNISLIYTVYNAIKKNVD